MNIKLGVLIPPNKLSNEEYHSITEINGIPCISSTDLKTISSEPKSWYLKNKLMKPQSDTLSLGNAIHQGMLEPDLFENKKHRYKFTPRNMEIMERSIYNGNIVFGESLKPFIKEYSLFVKDSVYIDNQKIDFIRKIRIDAYHKNGIVLDLKTSKCSNLTEFGKDVFSMGYHVSASYYIDTLLTGGFRGDQFGWLVLPSGIGSPFSCLATSNHIEIGRQIYQELIIKALRFIMQERKGLAFQNAPIPDYVAKKYNIGVES